jgi:hypothetical protein
MLDAAAGQTYFVKNKLTFKDGEHLEFMDPVKGAQELVKLKPLEDKFLLHAMAGNEPVAEAPTASSAGVSPAVSTTIGPEAAAFVQVFDKMPEKPYVIVQTLTDTDNETFAVSLCAGSYPLPPEKRVELLAKMKQRVPAAGADGLLVVRATMHCQMIQHSNPLLGLGGRVNTGATLTGAKATYRLEADVIKFVDEEIAARRGLLDGATVMERRRSLQELARQSRADAPASAKLAVRAYEIGEPRWAFTLAEQAWGLDRAAGMTVAPYLVAGLVLDKDEDEADKWMKRVLKELGEKDRSGYDPAEVARAFGNLAAGLPPEWTKRFTEASRPR